jgi:hypothetical protein
MVMTLLRNPSRIETASWLVLASVTIPALICGYLEGPVALCFRSLAIVVIGRVTPGAFRLNSFSAGKSPKKIVMPKFYFFLFFFLVLVSMIE